MCIVFILYKRKRSLKVNCYDLNRLNMYIKRHNNGQTDARKIYKVKNIEIDIYKKIVNCSIVNAIKGKNLKKFNRY